MISFAVGVIVGFASTAVVHVNGSVRFQTVGDPLQNAGRMILRGEEVCRHR